MRFSQFSVVFLLLATCVLAANGPLEGKTPAYFVDRYGAGKSRDEKSVSYAHPRRGMIPVKGQFSQRTFASGDLHVKATFWLPSLKLATVSYLLPRSWTDDQIKAALNAFTTEWAPVDQSGIVKSWIAPDGTRAVFILTTLYIQSPEFSQKAEKWLEEEDARKNSIPKF